jgi:hypothetical protein
MKILLGPGVHDPKGNEAFLVTALKRAADVRTFPAGLTWRQTRASLPFNWTPDVIIIRDAEFYQMPMGLERAEYPIVGLVGDYNLSLNQMLPVLGVFDHFFCDTKGQRIFNKLGFDNCDFFCLYGYDPDVHKDYGMGRDLDVVFVGNLNSTVQQERDEYIYQLAKLDRRHKVYITSGVFGQDYVHLLNRAHLVFNRSIRDEVNMRFFEALACGAIVLNNPLEELDMMGFVRNKHYLAYEVLAEAISDFFRTRMERKREEMRANAAMILENHSYDVRANVLLSKISSLDLNVSKRRMGLLSEQEASDRWNRYETNEVMLPDMGLVNRYHPIMVNWQKEIIENELEIRGFNFSIWSWWIELLRASGLDGYLNRFLAERLSLLDRFGCFQEEAKKINAMLNQSLYGFSVDKVA